MSLLGDGATPRQNHLEHIRQEVGFRVPQASAFVGGNRREVSEHDTTHAETMSCRKAEHTKMVRGVTSPINVNQ